MWRVLHRVQRVFERDKIRGAERFKEHFGAHYQASSSFNFDTSLVASGHKHNRGSRGWKGSEKCADDEWRCFFRRSCRRGSNAALEALGWGSALAVGLHLSHIWHNLMQWRMKCCKERHSGGQQFFSWHACSYLTLKRVLEFDGVEAVSPKKLDDCEKSSNGLDRAAPTSVAFASERGHNPLDILGGTAFSTTAEFESPLHIFRLFGAKDSDVEESVRDKPCIQLEESSLSDLEHEFSEVTRLFDGEALNAEANRLARAGQIGDAVVLWDKAATEYSCNQSYYNLGVAYQAGKGAKCDKDKALSCFMKAGDLGHVKGKFNAAVLLLEQESAQSVEQACFLLEQTAQCGLAEAQTQLAALYLERSDKSSQAVQLLAKASAQGHVTAKYMLGVCHEKGLGTEENCCAAADLYRQASEAGHSDATYNLGVFFENGLGGLPVDKAAALLLYSKAADMGDMMAFVDVERLRSDIATESNILHNTMPVKKRVVDVAKQGTLRSSSSCSNIIVTDSCDMPVEHNRQIFSDEAVKSAVSSAKSRRARFFVGDSKTENASYHGYENDEMIRFASLPFQPSLASENNLCLLVK